MLHLAWLRHRCATSCHLRRTAADHAALPGVSVAWKRKQQRLGRTEQVQGDARCTPLGSIRILPTSDWQLDTQRDLTGATCCAASMSWIDVPPAGCTRSLRTTSRLHRSSRWSAAADGRVRPAVRPSATTAWWPIAGVGRESGFPGAERSTGAKDWPTGPEPSATVARIRSGRSSVYRAVKPCSVGAMVIDGFEVLTFGAAAFGWHVLALFPSPP